MIFYVVFFLLVCSTLLWVTIKGEDVYPFSHYPMFSHRVGLTTLCICRVAIEKENGDIEWWQSPFYRYPEFVARKLSKLYDVSDVDKRNKMLALLEKKKILLEIYRLIEQDIDAKQYKAFHIVERRVSDTFEIIDKTIEIVSFNDLKNGAVS